jgi:hypothetical protein
MLATSISGIGECMIKCIVLWDSMWSPFKNASQSLENVFRRPTHILGLGKCGDLALGLYHLPLAKFYLKVLIARPV